MDNKDKFKAVWVSHSSIGDFLKCPRLYFLKNVYKNPKTGKKVAVMNPSLALGQAVHEVIEELSVLPITDRLTVSPVKKLDAAWEKISGEKGGFTTKPMEDEFKERGKKMLKYVEENPGPILKKAIKIKTDGMNPNYWLSEEEGLILNGKIDWIEYLDDDSIHIIDFKTGKHEEDRNSMQLPIYLLLATNTQSRKVSKLSYWYLESGKTKQLEIPDMLDSFEKVIKIARRIKLARALMLFRCPTNGCRHCLPYEEIFKNRGKLVGHSEFGQEIYIV